jgi:hypothetical protein
MTARSRLEANPFYVLGLRPGASRAEIEQEGQKLLGMLELGLDGAATYLTPFGAAVRTPDGVRRALAELRDPARRLAHELWARLEPGEVSAAPSAPGAEPWLDALSALGWRR